MEKIGLSVNLQSAPSVYETLETQERIVCSPEFPCGCIDAETGKPED